MHKLLNPLTILNISTFFQYQRFVMPISFLFYLHNGLTFSQFILCQSIYNATCLISKISFGFLGDIFSKKYILVFAYMCFTLRVLLWINFSGFAIILAGEILYGLFKAFYRGNIDSYIYEYLKQNNTNNQMVTKYGKIAFSNSTGSAISCIIGVLLYKFYGFNTILYAELATQIIAIILLLQIPNIKTVSNVNIKEYLKTIFNSIKNVLINCKINYYVIYSGTLSGLTNVFVWNFQSLLKLSSAPVFLFGLISFINQTLRAVGGWNANKILSKFSNKSLIIFEYAGVMISFALLLFGYITKNYILIFVPLVIICLIIMMFVVFNIFTVSKIHQYTKDYNRAVTSSTNTFIEDFMSVFLLLGFKVLYDKFGFIYSILISMIIVGLMLFPRMRVIKNSG